MRPRCFLSAAGLVVGLGVALDSRVSFAEAQDAGVAPVADVVAKQRRRSACIEHLPGGKTRPPMTERFPERSRAGYAAVLHLEVEHGRGETVLPGGFKLQLQGPEGRALERSGFVLADTTGPAAPVISRAETESGVTTTVELSFVPLPKEAGPQQMTLPNLPIAIARASGELTTLCTEAHLLQVDDPTSNIAGATPRGNPPPEPQLEVWEAAKNIAFGALVALPVGALLAFLITRWRRRERPQPPPPPPRPAWERALEALKVLRREPLLEQGLTREHFARVSAAVRAYLGDRYGFDGLETTTRELLSELGRVQPPIESMQDIEEFLRRADLVKFARLTPEVVECEEALEGGERIVRATMTELEVVVADGDSADPGPVGEDEETAS